MKKIALCGVVGWDCTPAALREALREANGEDVELEVSSPGGYIAPGLEMFNLIRNYAGNINVRITGYAMSMASYLPLAVKSRPNPGRIVAEDNAVYMIHNARGGAWGDHNDILGYGAYLKGLSGVIAKQYVRHTGKSLEDVQSMMDKETFFFGDEMVEHGFVDEIIATDKDDDKDTALATARAAFSDTMARLSADQEQARADWQRAAAILPEHEIQPPAAAGKPKEEVQQMALKDLLAANPAAQAEFDREMAGARAEGEKAVRATIDKVAPFLSSNQYPRVIGETALKVLKGEESMVTLTASVAAVDAVRESAAAAAAASETGATGATPPQQPTGVKETGAPVATAEDLEAEIARFQEGGN